MTNIIELIKKHTQEYNEYSFLRFTDGSIHFTKPIFVTRNIVKETDILPIRPVRELEPLTKASKNDDALVTINDFISFRGRDMILGETEIIFYNSGVGIEYTGIYSVKVDYNYELRKILMSIQNGSFGDTVFVNGVETSTHDFVLLEQELMYFPGGNESHTHRVYIKYDDINIITDTEDRYIYWRVNK